jgi:hypothetical protein
MPPKYKFWVQWSRSGAFVAKKFDASLFSKFVRSWHLFDQFGIDFPVVTKRSETPENMSFGSNRVDQVRSLRKISTKLHLANLCINGASSASFALTFVQ